MKLPSPRGPLSARIVDALAGDRVPATLADTAMTAPAHPLRDDDLQLALWILYELHYRGFEGVDDGWEWEPELLALRRRAEAPFAAALDALPVPCPSDEPIADQLFALIATDTGPDLSGHLQRRASLDQFREFLVHRSVYHLKEADPHSWGIPRLTGAAKAALVEIQADEYGGGRPERMHAELFRATLGSVGLSTEYGCYVDAVPGATLAISNAMSLFGLHRARRGQLVGHLAAFEMTSSLPNAKYARGLRRVSPDADTRFYDVHVTADALHEQIAAHDLCGSLVAAEPALAGDVLRGAAVALHLDNTFAEHVLGCWSAGLGSLRETGIRQAS